MIRANGSLVWHAEFAKSSATYQNPGNMTVRTLMQNRWSRWLLGFGFWTLLGLSFASQFYISSAKAGLEVSWRQAVNYALGDWYVFALLSVPVIHLARRFRFEGGAWTSSLPIHSIASVLFSLAYMVLLRAPRRDAPWVVLACAATFVGGRVGAAVLGPELGVFVGALTAGVVSNGYARLLRRPAHVTKVPSLLLLVPGSVGFRGLALLFQRDVVIGVEQAFRTPTIDTSK